MKPNTAWKRASEWALSRFTEPPPLTKPQALCFVVAMLLSIGLADYALGIRISLAVFYFVPILLAVAWFGSAVAVGVAIGAVCIRVVGDVLSIDEHALPLWLWWNLSSSLLVFLFVVWIFGNLLGLYRQMEQRVNERTDDLLEAVDDRRRLEHELLTVSANERNAMGQELHDDICQHLVATTLAAKVLAQRLRQQSNDLASEAQAIIALIEQGTGKTRQLARGLLLSSIEPDQLAEKLGELADEGSRSGVPCSFRRTGDALVASADTAAQLYRIAQEAMRNAIRHAGATHVAMSLVGDPQALCLRVEDDGRGLAANEASAGIGMGLPIMSYRAAYIGATLSMTPAAGRGTTLLCRLPSPLPAT